MKYVSNVFDKNEKANWQQKSAKEAEKALKRAMAIAPNTPQTMLHLAELYVHLNESEKALELAKKNVKNQKEKIARLMKEGLK